MGVVMQFFQFGDFSIEFFISALIFLSPLRHRDHWGRKILLGFCVIVLLPELLFPMSSISKEVWLLLTLLLGALFFWWCAEINIWDAIYGVVCCHAAQHIAYAAYGVLHLSLFPDLWYLPVFLLCMGVSYFLFARKMVLDGRYQIKPRSSLLFAVVILLIVFLFSKWAEQFSQQGLTDSTPLLLICRMYALCCCVFVLFLQTVLHRQMQAQNALRIQSILMENQRQQYELSAESIHYINQKCHNLKHQMEALRAISNADQRDRYLSEIEESVMIYDSSVKTGNEVLDTVLTEKSLICERERIQWTCVADGQQLDFLDPVDLYTIFGNALDNAIESIKKLEEPEQRVLAVTVYGKPGMAVIQIENYYDGVLQMNQGLPVTTKGNSMDHGYGLKSIREIAQKYGGSLSVDTENQIFLLSVLLPK
ncbi:MAG: GHKL domain-containing protein [Clostridiales bacterium]|nr:GHKL domain-containing protein [Clostridiales bacterium]